MGLNASTSIPPPTGTGKANDLQSAQNQATDQITPLLPLGSAPPPDQSQSRVSVPTTSAAAAADSQEVRDHDLGRSTVLSN